MLSFKKFLLSLVSIFLLWLVSKSFTWQQSFSLIQFSHISVESPDFSPSSSRLHPSTDQFCMLEIASHRSALKRGARGNAYTNLVMLNNNNFHHNKRANAADYETLHCEYERSSMAEYGYAPRFMRWFVDVRSNLLTIWQSELDCAKR